MKAAFVIQFVFTAITVGYGQYSQNYITIVNVGYCDNGSIADGIRRINEYQPHIIALDIELKKSKDKRSDTKLANALFECDRLVLPARLSVMSLNSGGKEMTFFASAFASEFEPPHAKVGFVSFIREASQFPKFFEPKVQLDGSSYFHFSVVTASLFDSARTAEFVRSNSNRVKIQLEERADFAILDMREVLSGRANLKEISGKIVVLGFMGPGKEDQYVVETETKGTLRTIYGVEVLARLIYQILE